MNFIDIKGRTVHNMLTLKNSVGKSERMILIKNDNQEEPFKLIFLNEIVNHKRFNLRPSVKIVQSNSARKTNKMS